MAKGIGKAAIESATGKTWDEWLDIFASFDAASMPHKEIVEKVCELGAAGDWWAQMVTVAYEQHIGRRIPGQMSDGTFALSVGKTVTGTIDDALAKWIAAVTDQPVLAEFTFSHAPETSQSERWRYWRAGFPDGTRVIVNISPKGDKKSAISVQHERFPTSELADEWRERWRSVLAGL